MVFVNCLQLEQSSSLHLGDGQTNVNAENPADGLSGQGKSDVTVLFLCVCVCGGGGGGGGRWVGRCLVCVHANVMHECVCGWVGGWCVWVGRWVVCVHANVMHVCVCG